MRQKDKGGGGVDLISDTVIHRKFISDGRLMMSAEVFYSSYSAALYHWRRLKRRGGGEKVGGASVKLSVISPPRTWS